MSNHSVQDGQEFAHAGGKRHLLGLASRDEPLVEGLNGRIATGGHQGSHVEPAPPLRAAAPDAALAPQGAAVSVQRRHTDKGGDLLTVQATQLRQTGEQGGGDYRPYPWGALEKVVLLSPDRARADGLSQVPIQVGQAPLKPADVFQDVGAHRPGRCPQAVLLGYQHLHQLAPPCQEGTQFLGGSIWEGTEGWPDGLGELGQDLRIDSVGLGQAAGGPGKLPCLTGVDDHHRQPGSGQGSDQGQLNTTCRLQNHQGGVEPDKMGHQFGDALVIVRDVPGKSSGPLGYVQPPLSHIDPDVDTAQVHSLLLSVRFSCPGPALQDAGSVAPATVRAPAGRLGRRDPAERRSSPTKGDAVCHVPLLVSSPWGRYKGDRGEGPY